MGYTTDFSGNFSLNKALDKATHDLLTGLATTRRMTRNIEGYGIEGEFYIEGKGFAEQDRDSTILDYNVPPKTQPGLWCNWVPTSDGLSIEWDCGEKFYNYVEWLVYLIDRVLAPRGYVLSGVVSWRGESHGDIGVISVTDNQVKTYDGVLTAPKLKSKTTKQVKSPAIRSKVTKDGKKYLLSTDLVKAFTKAKAMGATIDFVIEELGRISQVK